MILLPLLAQHEQHHVGVFVVAQPHVADPEGHFQRLLQDHLGFLVAPRGFAQGRKAPRQFLEKLLDAHPEHLHLLFLNEQRQQAIGAARLQIEDALAGLANRAQSDMSDRVEVEAQAGHGSHQEGLGLTAEGKADAL